MKKIMMCVLITVMVIISIASCGGKETGVKSDPNNEIVTLTWFVPGNKQPDIQTVMDEVAKITEPAIGARLDLQFIDVPAFTERMNMNMASGTEFDMCFAGYVNPYIDAVRKGGLLDITDLIEKQAPKLKEALPEYAWELAKVNGRIYAVPNLQIFAPPNSLVIFKDIADKYDFDFSSVKKMSDLEPYLEMVKNGEPNIYPYRPSYGTLMWTGGIYEEISSGVAIRCDGSSPEVFFIYETPEYQEGLRTLREWFLKGYIRPDIVSVGSDIQDYNAGKYAVSNSGWAPGAEIEVRNSLKREVMILPMMKPYLTKEKGLATMIAISRTSKNPEKSIKFIELINTNKELYNLVSYGVEGKHYNLDSEGKVEYIDDGGYSPKTAWAFGNQFNAILTKGQPDGIWKETDKLNREAIKSPILGFALDTTPIKNEISQISAVNSEFTTSGFIAEGLENKWDAYINKLEEAGRQKVLEEIQRQVNEWWEKNK